MTVGVREKVIAAVCDVLYVGESDFVDGDTTDLRDLGLDSVRFMLLMKQLGVSRESETLRMLAEDLSISGWVRELEKAGQGVAQ
ncbi:acyl carrier protein [Mycobacteroides salmoniphilum]|uniref:acyl carrier protein n=1 Tax=Mycobacteroides salmoniphilum TaxID=404941 RepID=UPI000991D636|nr:acyl carrier protein [Mycobacteroides salmoniphilum]